jgi:quinoprotein glucose dehydrogenase
MRTAVGLLRVSVALGVAVVTVGAVHYGGVVFKAYGLTSPLSFRRVSASFVVGRTVALDSWGVSQRLNRLLGVGMENTSVATMGSLSAADMEITVRPAGPDPTDTIVELGVRREGRGTALSPSVRREVPPAGRMWETSRGDVWGRKRSALEQIRRDNVDRLVPVLEIDAEALFGDEWVSNAEAPPLTHGGLIFWITAGERLVAADIASGELLWDMKVPSFGYSRRGFALDAGPGREATLFVPFGPMMAAIDAGTGRLVNDFGLRGIARLPGPTMVAPLLIGDEVIVASYDPQEVVGLDAATGEVRWSVPLHPESRNFSGGAPWSGLAFDAERSLLFVTTGNPRPALSGHTRPGDNRNSNSVIAIDLIGKRIEWAFQEVRHDLWDFDVPSGPILSTIEVEGRDYDVVIAVTKIGNTLILDRESGRPIFDFRRSRAPESTFARERTAEYQPDLRVPEPLIDIAFDTSMITDVSAASRAFVERQVADGRAVFGRFAPPALNRDHVTFGLHGGAEWHGASVDPDADRLYVAVNMIPWALRLYALTEQDGRPDGLRESETYTALCADCHRPSRDGSFVQEGEAAVDFVPSLHGYTSDPENREVFSVDFMTAAHDGPVASQEQLDTLWAVFEEWDRELIDRGALRLFSHWRQLLDQDGLPGSAPPWGKIVALDLGTGGKVWEVPFGEKRLPGGVEDTGSPSYGGLISSSGGLIFATGTDDRLIRAIDEETGEVVWSHRMAAAGSAPPITFEHDGQQYVAVVSTGGKFHNFVDRASRLYLFSLPN